MKRIMFSIGLFASQLVLAACAFSQLGGGGELTGKVWALSEMMGKGLVPDSGFTP